jgi:hypothetical protein
MLNHIASLMLAPQIMALPAAEPVEKDLRIVAVEQVGRPPYVPRDGRVYRLGGDAIEDVRLGEILIIRRPGEVRDIGLLRVVSLHTENFATNSALARLEHRGETYPLKGDVVSKLSPTAMPKIGKPAMTTFKDGLPPPLDPLVMPGITTGAAARAGLPVLSPPMVKRLAPVTPPGKGAKGAPALPPGTPNLLEQNAIYFVKGSSELSPRGVDRLKEWTRGWGRDGLRYFLAVPQNQLRLQELTVDRLAVLRRELQLLGVAGVELRTDPNDSRGEYDVVYVGVEGPARLR